MNKIEVMKEIESILHVNRDIKYELKLQYITVLYYPNLFDNTYYASRYEKALSWKYNSKSGSNVRVWPRLFHPHQVV